MASSRRKDLEQLVEVLHGQVEAARLQVSRFFDSLYQLIKTHIGYQSDYEPKLHLTPAIRSQPAWLKVGLDWEGMTLSLKYIYDGLGQLELALGDLADLGVPNYHPLVGHAKDVAAGAVLIAAIGSVLIGLLVIGPRLIALFASS